MDKFLKSVSERDFDRRISEVVEMLEEKQLYGTISLIKDLKYYLDLAIEEKTHTCNCQRDSNSRDSEPCCRCDSTLRAAAELGRSAYGFEIDRNFYERAKNEMLVFEKDEQMDLSDYI